MLGLILSDKEGAMRKQAMIFMWISFILFLSSCFNSSFKEGTEPDGFRNIKWGTNLESIENMQHVENKRDFDEEIVIYTKKDDELIIGGAALEKIEYSSWNNKFYKVGIYANGHANCTALRESAIEKFGKGKYKKKYIEWIGDKTIASFGTPLTDRCSLIILSYEIYEELINQSGQKYQSKAKEGAEKGF